MATPSKNSSQLSTILLISFTFILGLSTLYTEFFRPRINRKKSSKLLMANPVKKEILTNLKTIRIKNSNGEFIISNGHDGWTVQKPIKMNANTKALTQIISLLDSIEIQTLFQKDDVNLQNFALNNPSTEIEITSLKNESQNIKFGINNTIDQSSYLITDDVNAIFQINALSNFFTSLSLTSIINTSIFAEELKELIKFEVINARSNKTEHILQKVKQIWISNRYKTISNQSVENKIKSILDIKTMMIIDKITPSTNTFLTNYLDNPKYKLILTSSYGKSKYIITNPILSNDELKLKKRENFLIKKVNGDNIYVVKKNFLNRFFIRYSDLKKK